MHTLTCRGARGPLLLLEPRLEPRHGASRRRGVDRGRVCQLGRPQGCTCVQGRVCRSLANTCVVLSPAVAILAQASSAQFRLL